MNKFVYTGIILLALVLVSYVAYTNLSKSTVPESNTASDTQVTQIDTNTENPASVYCEENGGTLEIVTQKDGGQFALCNLGDYSCEEWTYYNGECDVEGDAELIHKALIAKGLNLEDMKVEIKKHLGDNIEGVVVPVSAPAGGGYVFATKTGSGMEIVADGNGTISCEAFSVYPDFSTYLVPQCYDYSTNTLVER